MTLRQISQEYRLAQAPIRERLRLLRQQEKTEKDPQKLFWIRRRKQMLSTMLQELRDLAELTEHYYERGYYRNEKYRL